MKAQALNDQSKYTFMAAKKILEINPYHNIISSLQQRVKDAPEDEATKELATVLYETALITAGFNVDQSASFASRVYNMLKSNLNLESLDVQEPSDDESEEEEEEKKPAASEDSDDDSDDSSSSSESGSSGNDKSSDDSNNESGSDSKSDRKDEL